MTGYIPTNADAQLQRALRDIWAKLDPMTQGGVLDMQGRRIINQGRGIDSEDSITLGQARGLDLAPTLSSGNPTPNITFPGFTGPVPIGLALAEGSSPYASRSDHVHTLASTAVGCRIEDNGQTIPTGVLTTNTFLGATERWDTDSMHIADDSKITFNHAGYYVIGCVTTWVANAVGRRTADIYLNGGAVSPIVGCNALSVGAAFLTEITCETVFYMDAGWYAEIKLTQDSGGDLGAVVQAWAHRLN